MHTVQYPVNVVQYSVHIFQWELGQSYIGKISLLKYVFFVLTKIKESLYSKKKIFWLFTPSTLNILKGEQLPR